MRIKMTQCHVYIGLFVFVSLLQRSIFPLFLLPLLLQEKRSLLGQIAEVKTYKDNNNDTIQYLQQQGQQQQYQIIELQNELKLILSKQNNCADKSQFLWVKNQLNSLESKVKKQEKNIEAQQNKINTQQTRQNLMLSKSSKQTNQICLLERDINSIQGMLKPLSPKVVPIQRRTLLAIDSANLDGAVKTLGIKVDYAELKRYINHRFGSLEARIYIGEDANNPGQQKWFEGLERNGYVIKTKPVVWHGDTPKANVDVDLTVDVLEHGANFKNVVLCSGDGDYVPLVEKLQKHGIKVIVLNLPGQTSHRLRKIADEYVSLRNIMGEISDRRQA